MLVFDKHSLRCVVPPTSDCDIPPTPSPLEDQPDGQNGQEVINIDSLNLNQA